jgi:protein gp37
MAQSSIEWTEMTWNPVTGCTKISSGCKFCYAEIMTRRLKGMGLEKYCNGFDLALHEDALEIPYTWKKSKLVFVNSMSDLFHRDVPLSFVQKVFDVMNQNPKHIFQVLTKRADILLKYSAKLNWTPNIWMGVTVENSDTLSRIDYLKLTPAHLKFLSCEPLLGPLGGIDLNGINWVIVGGESGRNPRSMKEDWVIEIQEKCKVFGVPFFFKQWGGRNKKKTGSELQGRMFKEMPMMKAA